MNGKTNGLSQQQQVLKDLGIVNGKVRVNNIIESERRRQQHLDRRTTSPSPSTGSFDYDWNNGEYDYAALTAPAPATRIRVKSVHAASTLDGIEVLSKVFNTTQLHQENGANQPPLRHIVQKHGVIVQLPPLQQPELEPHSPSSEASLLPRYVAVFRFGSVVFFNMSTQESEKLLRAIKQHGTEPVAAGFERKEHFEVVIQQQQQQYPPHIASVNGSCMVENSSDSDVVVTGDYCVVEALEMNSVAVISNIMAQTVVLDSYSDVVDELLANFASINAIVTRTGNLTDMEKVNLFRVIAQNNSIMLSLVSKLGIKDRSDAAAWELAQYEPIHSGLKEEFEIEDRFAHIEVKLEMISNNAKFFLEILHNQKSNTLEWIIIVLISFECVLMCLEMSGVGSQLFANIPEVLSFVSSTSPSPKGP